MAKETKQQLTARKQYNNPRIGMCDIPHCKTLQPQKARYHGLCWFHYRIIGYWAGKINHDLSWSGDPFAERYHKERLATFSAYCEWLGKRKAELQSNKIKEVVLDDWEQGSTFMELRR